MKRPIKGILRVLVIAGCMLGMQSGLLADQPNVVMIISDDHCWTDYGFMGHQQLSTPNLDRLAAHSLTFRHGYVPSSLCCPSLATIITGLYPHQHGIVANDPPIAKGMKPGEFQRSEAFRQGRKEMVGLIQAVPTLPGLLSRHGYRSLQTGKWWLGDYQTGGFTDGMTKGGRHGDEGLTIGRKTLQPITDFISQAKSTKKPFMVWYAPMMPHDPHTPPERLLKKYQAKTQSIHVARYWAMVEWFDETIGSLMKDLADQGVADNTIVVYVADNGWIQRPNNARYAEKSKQSPYDGGLRTPIMIHYPKRLKHAMIDTPISSIDLMPTILNLCGISYPTGKQNGAALPGIDLTDPQKIQARTTITGACFTHNFVEMKRPASSLRWRWCRQGDYKLIVPDGTNENGSPELYHLSNDPKETSNLAEQEPNRVDALTKELDRWWTGQ